MDKEFLAKLQKYMSQPEEERDLMAGATLLLQLNRNRILFQNITNRPEKHKERLFRELNKYLNIYSDQMTREGITRMEKEVVNIEQTTLKKLVATTGTDSIAHGKREDHETLPEEIKTLWVQNGDYARLMKSLHEKLKLMEQAKPCDRYDTLKQLVETDRKYRQNWEKYDKYILPENKQEQEKTTAEEKKETLIDVNRISANRKYLSLNKGKLADHKEKNNQVKYDELLAKIQERYDELKQAGQSVDEKQVKELVELGLKP